MNLSSGVKLILCKGPKGAAHVFLFGLLLVIVNRPFCFPDLQTHEGLEVTFFFS